MVITSVNRWSILRLTPKPDCWADIEASVREDCQRIDDIIYAADPTLAPVCLDLTTMIENALVKRAESQHHKLYIHPDLALSLRPENTYQWPDIIAGMTDTQSVHFKLAYSNDYEITVLPYSED